MSSIISPLQHHHRQIADDLQNKGYAVIDFLDEPETNAARKVYDDLEQEIMASTQNGIHMTTWMKDAAIRLKVRDQLEQIIRRASSTYFSSFKFLNTILIVKQKHKVSNFPIHQDWSFVDEQRFQPLNLWIALQDTSPANGGLFVVEGSHRLGNVIRGAGRLSPDFTSFRKELKSYLTPIRMKAGQAVIFPYALIHGSPANTTSRPRIIAATSIAPEQADLVINYYNEGNNTLEQYKVSDDFIYQYEDIRRESVERPPNGELIGKLSPYDIPAIGLKDIMKVSRPIERSLFQRILGKTP